MAVGLSVRASIACRELHQRCRASEIAIMRERKRQEEMEAAYEADCMDMDGMIVLLGVLAG